MISAWLVKVFGQNWKTTLAGIVAALGTVPQIITAIQEFEHGQPVEWRTALVSGVVAIGLFFAKDASTHSTADQVQQATATAAATPKQQPPATPAP